MPFFQEFFANWLEIINFAVEDDLDCAVLVCHRLGSGRREINHGKPPVTETDFAVSGNKNPLAVGTAMTEGVSHFNEFTLLNSFSILKIVEAGYAAHEDKLLNCLLLNC